MKNKMIDKQEIDSFLKRNLIFLTNQKVTSQKIA